MQLVHFYIKLVLNNGEFTLVSTNSEKNNGNIELDYDFSNNSTPSNTSITIHGITNEHALLFNKGKMVDVYAGFYDADWTQNNIHHVVNNIIYHVDPQKNDAGDLILALTLQDGTKKYDKDKTIKVATSQRVRNKSSMKSATDNVGQQDSKIRQQYNEWRSQNRNLSSRSTQVHTRRQQMNQQIANNRTQAYSNEARQQKNESNQEKYRYKTVYRTISFKPGTYGSSIIKKIASKAGIPIYKMDLVYDRKYINGYRAGKKPFTVIKEVAKDCKTPVYFPHGNLTIADYIKEPQTSVVLNTSNGLLNQPEFQQDDSGITYNVSAIFQPQLTVGSIFRIESSNLTGDVIIQSGHSSGSRSGTPTTDLNVREMSRYKHRQSVAISNAQKSSETSEQKRDKYNQQKAKNKRKARQNLKRK